VPAEINPEGNTPMSNGKRVTFSVDDKTHERLAAIAKRDDRTIGSILRQVVEQLIEGESQQQEKGNTSGAS
jgi:predicted transcriptional regulator